jgi:hypothetical protein
MCYLPDAAKLASAESQRRPQKTKAGPIHTRDIEVTFEKVPKLPKPAKTSVVPKNPWVMMSQQQLIESTNQLVVLMKNLIVMTSLNSMLGMSNME